MRASTAHCATICVGGEIFYSLAEAKVLIEPDRRFKDDIIFVSLFDLDDFTGRCPLPLGRSAPLRDSRADFLHRCNERLKQLAALFDGIAARSIDLRALQPTFN